MKYCSRVYIPSPDPEGLLRPLRGPQLQHRADQHGRVRLLHARIHLLRPGGRRGTGIIRAAGGGPGIQSGRHSHIALFVNVHRIFIFLSQIPYVKRANEYRPGMLQYLLWNVANCVAYDVFCPNSEPLQLFASPWTAPKWMKSNNDYSGQGYLLPEYYSAWANYFVKYGSICPCIYPLFCYWLHERHISGSSRSTRRKE